MRAPYSLTLIFPLRQLARLAVRLVLIALPLMALAQGQTPIPDAADPDGASAPLLHAGLKAGPAGGDVPIAAAIASTAEAARGWRAANDAVGAFPRGHADILVWEARFAGGLSQAPVPDLPAPAATTAPAATGEQPPKSPMGHGPGAMQPQQRHQHGSQP